MKEVLKGLGQPLQVGVLPLHQMLLLGHSLLLQERRPLGFCEYLAAVIFQKKVGQTQRHHDQNQHWLQEYHPAHFQKYQKDYHGPTHNQALQQHRPRLQELWDNHQNQPKCLQEDSTYFHRHWLLGLLHHELA